MPVVDEIVAQMAQNKTNLEIYFDRANYLGVDRVIRAIIESEVAISNSDTR